MTDEGRPINTLSFALPRLGYSQALVEISNDREWWLWFWNCVKVAGDTRAEVFPDEDPNPAIRVIDDTPAPAAPHQNPSGQRVDQHPPSTTAPPPQQPPAAPQGTQSGVPDKGVVPGEFCDQCNQPAHYKASFTSRANKVVGATLICTVCKSPNGKYDYNIRWLNDDDVAWSVIRPGTVAAGAPTADGAPMPEIEPSDLPF